MIYIYIFIKYKDTYTHTLYIYIHTHTVHIYKKYIYIHIYIYICIYIHCVYIYIDTYHNIYICHSQSVAIAISQALTTPISKDCAINSSSFRPKFPTLEYTRTAWVHVKRSAKMGGSSTPPESMVDVSCPWLDAGRGLPTPG